MDPVMIIVLAGFVVILSVLIILSMNILNSERIGLGWRCTILLLLGVSANLALVTVVWFASNLAAWQ